MIHSGPVAIHDALGDLLVDIDDLQPHPLNPNNGDLDAVAASIELHGMYRPVYARATTRYILAGNTTWAACKQLGATHIPTVYLDVDDVTATKILLGDNKIAALAVRDPGLELQLLQALDDDPDNWAGLQGTGYTDTDLTLLTRLGQTPITDDDFNDPWPTICVQVPPHVRNAYMTMTAAAGGDRQRFETLLRLAGWDG